MNKVYCVSVRGEIRDVSKTERGAKNYATRHGFSEIFSRSNTSCYVVVEVASKIGRKWKKTT